MLARDFMTPDPVFVSSHTSVREIAQKLVARGVSALPVLAASGEVIGMVSEGDLIRGADGMSSDNQKALPRKDWWLSLVAGGEAATKPFPEMPERTAEQIMSSPVVTVTGATDLGEVAHLLRDYRIKRVPVVENGKLVGIVSRADLLRAFIGENPAKPLPTGGFHGLLAEATAHLSKYLPHESAPKAPSSVTTPPASDIRTVPAAQDFRGLMADFEQEKVIRRQTAKLATIEARKALVRDMINTHVSDQLWAQILNDAAVAASQGLNEHLLLRFPNDLCSDGGRTIRQSEDGWEATLRGEAAEVYLRWKTDLEPRGFHLKARTVEYVESFPGDIGLFLNWAPESLT